MISVAIDHDVILVVSGSRVKDRMIPKTFSQICRMPDLLAFSDVYSAAKGQGAVGSTSHYDDFRRGVFEDEPFTQRFQDVHISQDGSLADVSLVFVNTAKGGSSWGWKTMQMLKVAGQWKIAGEFYTGHG